MTLAPYVRILGRGPGRSRSFTLDEAEAALGVVLRGEAAPEAVGAMLMLLRMKGETPEEIAGFACAARASLGPWPGPVPALDWPSYAAGRTRGLPWFLLAARALGEAGVPVLLHGRNMGTGGPVRAALGPLGIPTAASPAEAARLMGQGGTAYLPLEAFSPELTRLLKLREHLGLRSCINTVLRVMNPAGAPAAVQGVFHPPYIGLQAEAAAVLDTPRVTILKNGGGEFERNPFKDLALAGRRDGAAWSMVAPALLDDARRMAEGPTDPAALAAFWDGALADPFAEAVVLGTLALAADAAGLPGEPEAVAQAIWRDRRRLRAA